MATQKKISLYKYIDGVNDTLIYDEKGESIDIGEFSYEAKRMGGAPTISAKIKSSSYMNEDVWASVYTIFNEEKYYIKQVPTSSFSNSDGIYIYTLQFISERVALDNIYFFDVVSKYSELDKPSSNSSSFLFSGNIKEFAERLNDSLLYSKLQTVDGDGIRKGYVVYVDGDISADEEKLISFEDQFFSTALQEVYNTYGIPYYFNGKEIHIGYTNNTIQKVFKYGIDDSLLSIEKTNANYKWVNRVAGIGSSENLPYYYPNNSPKGKLAAKGSDGSYINIYDHNKYANKIPLDGVITYYSSLGNRMSLIGISRDGILYSQYDGSDIDINISNMQPQVIWMKYNLSIANKSVIGITGTIAVDGADFSVKEFLRYAKINDREIWFNDNDPDFGILEEGTYEFYLGFSFGYRGRNDYKVSFSYYLASYGFWYDESNKKKIGLSDVGLSLTKNVSAGYTITQEVSQYIKPVENLMPPIFRNSGGEERFYNAIDGKYIDDSGNEIYFKNAYNGTNPHEQIVSFDDIAPTIKGTKVNGLNIDMFSEFAYDDDDNDNTYEDEDGNVYYEHPYFFAKLRPLGFNLFDCAIEGNDMTISMTSGKCSACSFKIMVSDDEIPKNTVQVNSDGTLKRDLSTGRVLCTNVNTVQDSQQDTTDNSVWIALMKDEETFGTIMPKVGNIELNEYKPSACTKGLNDGDTFVILGINLPQAYIDNAEQKLEKEIINYLYENNEEKFNFSIGFSRIFLEENESILKLLDENARIYIEYAGKEYLQYVSSYSYSMNSKDILPEIKVTLSESLSTSTNTLQQAISSVKTEVGKALSNIDITSLMGRNFIRKDQNDEANGIVNFKRGIKFGEGGRVDILENNGAKLTIEYLEVTKKATYTSLEIAEKTHIGGQLLVTPASMICSEVEEFDEYYRCYFQTKGESGEQIFNQFALGDQAICQTYNNWNIHYYWRLVVGVGEDYIDLSKSDCDEGSDKPLSGDKIIQLGNREDNNRQAAVAISAYGDNTPSLIQYSEINSFSLVGKNINGMAFSDADKRPKFYIYGDAFIGDRELKNNFITFQIREGETQPTLFINAKVEIGSGSSGLSNLSEWSGKQEQIDSNTQATKDAQNTANSALESASDATIIAKNAKDAADAARLAAQSAQDSADSAKSVADAASAQMDEWAKDDIISPLEKLELKTELANVNADYLDIRKQTLIYTLIDEVDVWNNYVTAYNNYVDKLNKIISTEGSVAIGNLSTLQVAYYNQRTSILDAIADAARKVADDAQSSADKAQETAEKAIQDAEAVKLIADNALLSARNAQDYIDSTISPDIENLTRRLDGVVENWFFKYSPSLDTEPTSNWTTDEEKTNHIGDTFTNTQEYISDSETPDSGKSWRWVKENNTFLWTPISDSDAVKALQQAAKAQTTADGKNRIFYGTPYVPYDVGDMWSNGSSGDIMICIKSSTTSFSNSHWIKASKYTDDTALTDFISGDYADTISDIESQIDGKAETWYQSDDPSSNWTTSTLKQEHIGDLWLNTSGSTVSGIEPGLTAIWNGTSWVQFKVPNEVFDQIDGKVDIFTSQPTPPYKIKDLWVQGNSGDIMVCVQTRASGSYSSSDWSKASKYTDDTAANKAQTSANEAKDAANKAQEDADSANAELDKLKDDGKISPLEKPALKQQLADIQSEYAQIVSQAGKYGVSTTEYASAYTKAYNALVKYTDSSSEYITINSDYANISAYYTARQNILNAIVEATKSIEEDTKSSIALIESATNNLDTKITDVESGVTQSISEINAALDGKVESYFGAYEPTTSNSPASDWTTTQEKENHIGDTFTCTSSQSSDPTNYGRSWRWMNTYDGISGYHWHPITDQDALTALVDASKAQSTADGKSTTFITKPTNYSQGDLWILQSDSDHTPEKTGDILTAQNARTYYVKSDWVKQVKYTDDTALTNFISGDYADTISDIESQIDGKAETWYQSDDPSSNWTTSTLKQEHIGDLWYNTTDNTTQRWNGYSWSAQEVPTEVFNTIQKKAQIFVTTPTPPYYVGDLWVQGETGDILRCKTASSIIYLSTHWEKASKYTDDTAANEALQNAANALEAANAAKSSAESAIDKLNIISSDDYISPSEKTALAQQRIDIQSEYAQIISDCAKYSVSYTAFTTAYNRANTALGYYTSTTEENIQILTSGTYNYSYIAAYYTARQTILDSIAAAAKKIADDAAELATEANDKAESAKLSAEEALGKVESLNDDNYLTLTEKRSLRQVMQSITSQKGTAFVYSGKITRTMNNGDDWIKVTEEDAESDSRLLPYIGFYRSQNRTHSSYSTVKLTFTLETDAVVNLEYASYGEANYDYTVIAKIDTDVDLTGKNYSDSSIVDVTTYGNINKIFEKSYNLSAGTHTLQIMYRKDPSGSYYLDSGFYRITTEKVEGVNDGLSGSFHENYWMAQERINDGYDASGELDNYAEYLDGLLEELMTYMTDTCYIWEDSTTEFAVTSNDPTPGVTVRNKIYALLREYYKYEDLLNYKNIANDSDYLTSIFGRGKTEFIGGAILNEAVAVRNENGEIEGILNGSSNFSDTEHGKAILIAGIPEVTEEDSTELVDRADVALTTIFEDGTIKSNSGDFAGLKIGKYKNPLGVEETNASVYLDRTKSDSSYKYSTGIKLSNGKIYAFGTKCDSSSCYIGNDLTVDAGVDNSSDNYTGVLTINATDRMSIYSSGTGNIEVEKGDIVTRYGNFISQTGKIKGLRLSITYVTSTLYIDPASITSNVFVVDVSTATKNIYIQSSGNVPYDGQVYEFYKYGSYTLYLRSNLSNIINSSTASGTTVISITTFYTKVIYSEELAKWLLITM